MKAKLKIYDPYSQTEPAAVSLGQAQWRDSMWVVNVILIFSAIALISWLLWNYGEELTKALSVMLSGCESVVFAIGVILFEAIKAAIIAALIGAVFGLIFFVARAPEPTIKAVALSIACLAFSLLMIKILWENFNNLRWSFRHAIRNHYRKR